MTYKEKPMGVFSDDDINEAERMISDLTPERKKQLAFLKGFEEGWKQIKMYFAEYPQGGQIYKSHYWATDILKKLFLLYGTGILSGRVW